MAEPAKVLILGGTGEAAALAARLAADPRLAVTTSLAGRTKAPATLPGAVRCGGFGGAEGLASHLEAERVDLLIDATHPFAAQISEHAAEACVATGTPRLQLVRPAWQPREGDDWRHAASLESAAALLDGLGQRIFLTIGRQELAPFAGLRQHWFMVRMIDPPETPPPLDRFELLLARGPFDEAEEVALLQRHGIEALVAKNSGGAATYAKIAAARTLALPVVMVARPPAPPGEQVADVEAALAWIEARIASHPATASLQAG